MAQVTIIKVVESDANIVIRINLQSDGTGELVNYPILSPQDLRPPRRGNQPCFRLNQIWWGLVWFDATLSAGTLNPVDLWTIARDSNVHVDFRSFGGLVDQNVYPLPPVVDDGVLLLSTNGFAVPGSRGTITLQIAKTTERKPDGVTPA